MSATDIVDEIFKIRLAKVNFCIKKTDITSAMSGIFVTRPVIRNKYYIIVI